VQDVRHPSPSLSPTLGRGSKSSFVRSRRARLHPDASRRACRGLHAGLIYNTWPSMGGRVFRNCNSPGQDSSKTPASHSSITASARTSSSSSDSDDRHGPSREVGEARDRCASLVGSLVVFQVGLGITTLLWQRRSVSPRCTSSPPRCCSARRCGRRSTASRSPFDRLRVRI